MLPAAGAVVLLIIGGIKLNTGPNQVSVTYTQVNITIKLIPIVRAAGVGGALDHRKDSVKSMYKPGECHIHT